jgi:hypothetical protein
MKQKFSYLWYIKQFQEAKVRAEKFILSVNDNHFQQPPAEGHWSIAECYSHLINYGKLYFDNQAAGISNTQVTTEDLEQSFQPRWIVRKVVSFFEPPYKIKLKTVKAMKPDSVSDYDRMELLDGYINLQDRFIAQLEKGQHRHVDLSNVKIKHPLISFIRITLTECFALAEAHQRRHQWQAEQTLAAVKKHG